MLHILVGADDYSLNESLGALKRGLGDQPLLAANTATLDGKQLTSDQLRQVCMALPFLAPKRLVIVRGLLERFEPKPARQQKKGKDSQQNEHKAFAALIDELPDSTELVLIDHEVKNKNPLLRALLPRAEFRSFPLLKSEKLHQWIRKRVRQEGGTISLPAVELLAGLVGGNLWAMAGEISKLVLFASGRLIEEEDVRAVVGYSRQASIFNMVDAILESRARQAQQAVQQLSQMGMAPPYLLYMLARQARLLVRAKELVKKGEPDFEIQSRLGLTSDFAWRRTAEQASRYSIGRLRELYHQLLAADLSIKTGKYEPELALNILAAELCRQTD